MKSLLKTVYQPDRLRIAWGDPTEQTQYALKIRDLQQHMQQNQVSLTYTNEFVCMFYVTGETSPVVTVRQQLKLFPFD